MSKNIVSLVILCVVTILFCGCTEEDGNDVNALGTIELKFDNIVSDQTAGILSNPGSEEYGYVNSKDQSFNLTLIKYIVSEIILEGPDDAYYADILDISGDDVTGYYLVDESDLTSQRIEISEVANGIYDKITFKIGVESEGISQGASIILDGMFWAWSSGYIGMKVEGQSPDSPGESFGDTIEETNPYGFAYHIGGWSNPNNVRTVSVSVDEFLVSSSYKPEIHLVVDFAKFVDGDQSVNFSTQNSVHDASSGEIYADNILNMFSFDHVHNNPL